MKEIYFDLRLSRKRKIKEETTCFNAQQRFVIRLPLSLLQFIENQKQKYAA